jgi:hypothetical protein
VATITLITGIPALRHKLRLRTPEHPAELRGSHRANEGPQHGDVDRVVYEIVRCGEATRARLLSKGVVPSTTINGVIADNFFAEAKADGGIRLGFARGSDVEIDKPLAPGFRLLIKHPGTFTVLAKPLVARVPLFAIVRNPLAALVSWQTVDLAVRHGHLPVTEAFAPDLQDRLNQIDHLVDRQVALVQWIFQVYRGLPRERVLRYESIVPDPSAAVRPLSGSAAPLRPSGARRRPGARYPGVDLAALAEALLTIEADVEPFYPDFAASLRPHFTGA